MFTGLIQQKGIISGLEKTDTHGVLEIETAPWDRPVQLGESIAVQGVCLTVARMDGQRYAFDVLGETFLRTNLGEKKMGQTVNLERALRHGDPLGGHMVQGHVDGCGRARAIRPVARDFIVEIDCPESILQHVVFKGSIALDGISLTVAAVDPAGFSVHIIPHTWQVTTLSDLREGDSVNLEADPLAKYVEQALRTRKPVLPLDWDAIRQGGYTLLEES